MSIFQKSKLFLVLSVPRSGSSALAGTLHFLGVDMGSDLLKAAPSNPKGHFENRYFVKLNDLILELFDATWHTPPSREIITSENLGMYRIQELLNKEIKPIWGLKDPRTVLTFNIWKPYLETIADITYVFVWRPIEESVASLAYRDNMNLDTATKILKVYFMNLKYYRKQLKKENKDIVDICFQELLEKPEIFVGEVNLRINQSHDHNLDIVKDFLDEKLKHF
ncbi:sulfotransferase family protein [Bacillus sp. GX]|uniref:Glycosyl transferase group 1 n=3 Tax=Bacteria TaxID=2 RepID=A0A1J9UBT6_9BACI|nr:MULTISPECIES: sulfotransferase family protein [Bacillus]OJD61655.1 glycosyl transferase group 1 [Bacillus albus]RXJ09875.1 sulfotransferase family protein [Bacillus albus]RXJ21777.1 sulfotransferase family protein [Bacillus albus]RXJ22812.1 sulfotransferase family protein [Bacillus albus]RXJ33820.1 sulfotransferase family protein [Bacillus albus]